MGKLTHSLILSRSLLDISVHLFSLMAQWVMRYFILWKILV